VKDDSGVYMRERAAGLYRLSAYLLAVITTELFAILRLCSIFVVVVYWIANLMPAAMNFIAYWLVVILMTLAVESFGLLISVVLPSHALIFAFDNCFLFFAMVTGTACMTSWVVLRHLGTDTVTLVFPWVAGLA